MTKPTAAPAEAIPVFDCEQTVRRLWDYLDGQLGPVDLAAVDSHLAACDRCPPHFAFERRFLDVVREVRGASAGPNGSEATLRARVLAALRADGVELSPELQS
jgi:anti-sigma factor (TIGR02949 family)